MPRSAPLRCLVLALLSLASAPLGCNGKVDAGSADAAAGACSWPSIFDDPTGSTSQCMAGRAYVSCVAANGGGELCLSDDPTTCSGASANATTGLTYTSCQDLCHPDEYALVCGTIGPPPGSGSPAGLAPNTAPSSCRAIAENPGGREPYCCPCGGGAGQEDAGASSVGAGDASAPPPAPEVAVLSQVGASASAPATTCPLAMGNAWLQIGMPGAATEASGSKQSGDIVTASCTVHATGPHAYSVQASVLLAGEGSITIPQVTLTDDLAAVQPGVSASFERDDTGTFASRDCTFDFGNQPGDLASNANMGIAPGRLWGNLLCPTALDGENGEMCSAAAEVLFENCTQ